jgi:hypothetical protein
VCFLGGTIVAYYDGRASAAENYEERTGIATGTGPTSLSALGSVPFAQSPHAHGGLRYMDILPLPDGRHRLYYEMTGADGAHDLRTELRLSLSAGLAGLLRMARGHAVLTVIPAGGAPRPG